jgi:hypothetical protein
MIEVLDQERKTSTTGAAAAVRHVRAVGTRRGVLIQQFSMAIG